MSQSTVCGVEHWPDSVYDKHVNQSLNWVIVIALSMCDPINPLVSLTGIPLSVLIRRALVNFRKLQSLPSLSKFTEMFRGFSYQDDNWLPKLCTKRIKSYREEISKTKFFVRTFVCRREHVIALALCSIILLSIISLGIVLICNQDNKKDVNL